MSASTLFDKWSPRHDSQKVDLAFLIDCTGSMASYISQAQRNICRIAETISKTAFDVRLALVEYRDHPPQESTFVVNTHDFTSSVAEMKGWVDNTSARGGGDTPEAVADGLHATLNLSYRPTATRICVLIADAPPHGLHLESTDDDGFPDGCPSDHDPISICHEMAQRGIILYCVGCEPAIVVSRDFFMAISHITGGQYIGLHRAATLSQVIINSTLEEVHNEQLMGHIDDHLHLALAKNEKATVSELTTTVHEVLRLNHNQTVRVQSGGNDLTEVSEIGRRLSFTRTLLEARALMNTTGNAGAGTAVEESFDITALDEVTPRTCERLVRRGLARRGRFPTEHSETTESSPTENTDQ